MELVVPVKVEITNMVKELCDCLKTCEDPSGKKCPYWIEHQGCYFRGKTPKEWGDLEEAINVLEQAKKGK